MWCGWRNLLLFFFNSLVEYKFFYSEFVFEKTLFKQWPNFFCFRCFKPLLNKLVILIINDLLWINQSSLQAIHAVVDLVPTAAHVIQLGRVLDVYAHQATLELTVKHPSWVGLRGNFTPKQTWVCFVRYFKLSTFFRKTVQASQSKLSGKWHLDFQ